MPRTPKPSVADAPTVPSDIVLAGHDLLKDYDTGKTKVRALDGVSLSVGRGSYVSIMGPSGSGKSTLLHLLGGLDKATSGEVMIDGTAMSTLSDKELTLARRHKIGFVFQFFNLVPVLSVEENVALPALIDGKKPKEYRDRLDKVLSMVGLADHRDHLPSEISGGQQQRTAIARALFTEPAVMLADEPTGNLDSKTGAEVLLLIKQAQLQLGQTVVMVTHDARAASYGDEVILLEDGRIADRLTFAPGTEAGGDERAQAVLAWLQTSSA